MAGPVPPRTGRQAIVQGLALLGRFRADGFARFEATPQAFLASLAPWLAFLLVGGALLALQGRPREAATDVAVLLCWLLAPPVVSQLVARLFSRGDRWLRYVTATTWCEWLMIVAYGLGVAAVTVLVNLGMPLRVAPPVLLGAIAVYWLALHLFLARRGLDLTLPRASAIVGAVVGADLVLFELGRLVGGPASHLLGLQG